MDAKAQADFMISHHGSKDAALEQHNRIMNNVSSIYKSIEHCRKNSLSYKHLEDVKSFITDSNKTPKTK